MRPVLFSSAYLFAVPLVLTACGGSSSDPSPSPAPESTPTDAPATLQPATTAPSPTPTPASPDPFGFTCDPLQSAPRVYRDPDGDGFGSVEGTCADAPYLSLRRGDCDESSTSTHPGAQDVAGDGQDSDCGGTDNADPHVGLSGDSVSFQQALEQAVAGQRIWVGPGDSTFAADLTVLPGVEVLSTDGPELTALEGTNLSALTVGGIDQSRRAVLDGFLIVHPIDHEGGVVNAHGAFWLNDLRFWGPCDDTFGALLISDASGAEVSSVDIRGCQADAAGGISVVESQDVFLRDISVSGTSGKYQAGGIWIYQSSVRAENLYISDCVGVTQGTDAEVYGGGGILVQGYEQIDASLELTGPVTVQRCSTPLDGGGIALKQASLKGDGALTLLDNAASGNGGGIHAVDSYVHLATTRIEGSTANQGGGIWMSDGSLELEDALIRSNRAIELDIEGEQPPTTGGGLFLQNASLALTRVQLEANDANLGGGAYLLRPSSVQFDAVSFDFNRAGTYGGGLFYNVEGGWFSSMHFYGNTADSGAGLYGEGAAWVTDSTFAQNEAVSEGGGLRLVYGSASSLEILDNYAGLRGGGMVVEGTSSTLTDLFIVGNSTFSFGGGLVVEAYTRLSLTDSFISSNRSELTGGGIGVAPSAWLQARGLELVQNSAGSYGGGLGAEQAQVALSESLVADNSAGPGYGGGLYMDGGDSLTLSDTLVSANRALDGAGAFVSGTGAFTRTTFAGNVAEQNGGGLYFYGSYPFAMDSSVVFSSNKAENVGGGVFMLPCSTPLYATLESATYVGNTAGNSADSNCLQ